MLIKVAIGLFASFFGALVQAQTHQTRHSVSIPSSKLIIHGSTNVNRFDCALEQNGSANALSVTSRWTDLNLTFDGLELAYPVAQLDCGVELMNKDLRDLLNEPEFPNFFLQINSIQIHPANREIERLAVAAEVTITLAGVTRQVVIGRGTVINRSAEEMVLLGATRLKMTDFGITPPTKFLGMVTVTDELEIEFEVTMKVVALK